MTAIQTQPRIEKITVELIHDENPDTSTIGEYTDETVSWAIVRHGEHASQYIANLPDDAELPERGREYRYFLPYAGGEEPGSIFGVSNPTVTTSTLPK